ncbi:HNH endonuclease [Streptomyces prunicolor]|uniref:HNH endonuclease n=1 Tax=Streptomyces prunicolor TaxID=67348 RepID=UPI0003604E7B
MSQHSSKGAKWEALRLQVLQRDQYVCQLQFGDCEGQATQVDHIIAKNNGGTDTLDNLQAACRKCNGRKQDKDVVRTTYINRRWL